MIMINYYVHVLKNYVTFDGRARRSEFWYFTLCNFLVSFVLSIIFSLIGLGFVANIYSLAVLLPTIAVSIRRMHDIDKSGWFILIPIYSIILFATQGNMGENRFGNDPIENDPIANENAAMSANGVNKSIETKKDNNIVE